jgi:sugar diacid utilization regulator
MTGPGAAEEVRAALAAAAQETGLTVDLLGDAARLLAEAAAGREPEPDALATFAALGTVAAERGVSLQSLVGLYLSAVWRLWPLLPRVGGAGEVAGRQGGQALRAARNLLAAAAEGHEAAQRQAARHAEARRREFIDDLLTASGDVATVAGRGRELGLRLSAEHRVLAVRADRPLADFGPVARELSAGLGRGATGHLVTSKDGLLTVLLRADGSEPWVRYVSTRVRALEPARRWQVAVSEQRSGVGGIRRAWRESRQTLDLARRLGLDGPEVYAADLLGHAQLLADTPALAEFVERVLGPLRTARGGPRPLVDTLVALVDADGNTAAAARALHLSVRAVLYRLKRISAATGYDPAVPEQRFTLRTAAVGARLLGWPAGEG